MGRRIRRIIIRALVIGPLWGVPWAFLFARSTDEPFLHVLPIGLIGGAVFGLFMAIMIAVFEHATKGEVKLGFGWLRAKEPPIDVVGQPPYRAAGQRASHVDERIACPWCGGRAMSRLRKSCIGPAMSVACESCTKRVSVSPRHAFLLLMPPFASFGGAYVLVTLAYSWAALALPLIVATFVLCFVLHDRVPLVRR